MFGKMSQGPIELKCDDGSTVRFWAAQKMCGHCHKSGAKLLRCGRCKKVYYCNVECQKKDWATNHRAQCSTAPSNESSK